MTTVITVPTVEHQPAGWEAWDCDCAGTGRISYGRRWEEPCPLCAAGFRRCEGWTDAGQRCPNPATHRALRCRTLYCDTCYEED